MILPCFFVLFIVYTEQGQDVGVLCHTAPDELCKQVYQESEAIWPAALSVGRWCGAEQAGLEVGCTGAGTKS